MGDDERRSITPTTAESDTYVDQIDALAAKARQRKRWYVARPTSTIDHVEDSYSNPETDEVEVEST